MELKQIEEFITNWQIEAISYYNNKYNEYEKNYYLLNGEDKNKLLKDTSFFIKGLRLRSKEDRQKVIFKFVENEAARKKRKFYAEIQKKGGEIIDARELSIGSNCDLNGIIICEKGKVKIETIIAGGYNVQILHYRVLVNLLK